MTNKAASVKGPLLAIASGLQAVDAQYCLIVPTDMPFLKPEVADYLLEACKDYNVAVPIWPDGTVETLLMALERESCIEIAQTLCTLNRANADGIIRAVKQTTSCFATKTNPATWTLNLEVSST